MLTGKKYDLVFVVSPSFMSGFLGLYYRFFYRKSKVVYHIQDLQIDAAEELKMITRAKLLQRIKWSEGKILSSVDWVTTISSGMLKKIERKPYKIKNLLIFPNWADFEKIHRKEPDIQKIAFLNLPFQKRMVLYSGAIGEKQGLEMILTAAGKAEQQIEDLFFVISGSGPYREILKKNADDRGLKNVYFIDIQPVEIFNELLNIAWLHLVLQKEKVSDLLLPSKFSNILAVGGLALVTCSPGTNLFEIIEKNRLAIAIPPDNPSVFWEAIFKISQNKDVILQIKASAEHYAKHNLDKEMIINAFFEKLY
jgi:colanic acid biosynthesis glycosyl transferase WcaI